GSMSPCRKIKTPEVIATRAAEYRRLRAALGMSRADLSQLTGLAMSSLEQMADDPAGRAPAADGLGRQRRAPVRRPTPGAAPATTSTPQPPTATAAATIT